VDDLRVTMVGHATLLIQVAGINMLTDPVWSRRASPVSFAGPKRVRAPGIAFDRLPRIDLVLLSHNHYANLDVETLRRLEAAHDPLVVTPLGNDRIVRDAVSSMRVAVGDWSDSVEASGVVVRFEPPHHWSARGMHDRRMALWSSFVVETSVGRIYHVVDTGFHDGINYRTAAERHGGFRLAVLPIGAYAPRWFMASQHQDPDEAVRGMLLAKGRLRSRPPLVDVLAHRRGDPRARATPVGRGCEARHSAGTLQADAARRNVERACARAKRFITEQQVTDWADRRTKVRYRASPADSGRAGNPPVRSQAVKKTVPPLSTQPSRWALWKRTSGSGPSGFDPASHTKGLRTVH
jgi:L-ascorbate metabolism protein UlaG (beta-lactamase superfamily)